MPGFDLMVIRAVLLACLAWLIVPLQWQYDFGQYWSPANFIVNNRNPYQQLSLDAFRARYNFPAPDGFDPSESNPINNPAAYAFFLPLAFFSFSAAQSLNALFFFFGMALAAQLLHAVYRKDQQRPARLLEYCAALPVGLVAIEWHWGSPAWLALLGVSAGLYAIQYGRIFAAGVFFSAMVVKPHLFWVFGCALLGWCIVKKNWRTPAALLLSVLAECTIVLYFHPRTVHEFLDVYKSLGQFSYLQPTIPSYVSCYLHIFSVSIRMLPAILIGLAALLIVVGRKASSLNLIAAHSLPLSLLFAPYAWDHDYIAAIPTLFFISCNLFSWLQHGTKGEVQKGFIFLIAAHFLTLFTALSGSGYQPIFLLYGFILVRLNLLIHYARQTHRTACQLISK